MSGVQVVAYDYPRAVFEAAPEDQRIYYLMIGQLWNDLQVLSKQMIYASTSKESDAPEWARFSQLAIELLNLRLLAARLHEAEQLLRRIGKVLPKWSVVAKPHEIDALKKLVTYFKGGNSVLTRVRQKIGAHQDSDVPALSAARMTDDDLLDFQAATFGNTLYMSAELLQLHALSELTGEARPLDALNKVRDHSVDVMNWANTVCQAYQSWFLRTHIFPYRRVSEADILQLDGLERIENVTLPYFTIMPDDERRDVRELVGRNTRPGK